MIAEEALDRRYIAYGGAAEVFKANEREVLCDSGAGTGKTFSLLWHANYTARRYPHCRLFFARDTRKSLNESVLEDWETKILWPGHPAITGTATKEHRDSYTYPNGSRIVLIGMDNVDKHMSAQYDKGYLFESHEFSEEDIEKLLSRLRNGMTDAHQLLMDVNPQAAGHHLNQRFPKPSEKNPANGRRRIWFRHEDNPRWYDHERCEWTKEGVEYIRDILGSLSGVMRKRLLEHKWVSAEGQVWPQFDRDVHCIAKAPECRAWRASMDFGYNAPGCFQVWGIDNDLRAYRVAEVYKRGWSLEQWADAILALRKEFPFDYAVADAAEPRSIDFLNDKLGFRPEAVDRIFHACDKSRGKQFGLDHVRDCLRPDKSGRPMIYFVKDALRFGADDWCRLHKRPCCTEQEIEAYVFKKNEDGKAIKDEPESSCADHGCDATEYFCVNAWKRNPLPIEKKWRFPPAPKGSLSVADAMDFAEVAIKENW